ncbi:chymotrypsin-1-like [Drosophila innubila]|uniref:chymotrypsin-1-like n=1 Tax=Drosophila innubila TaxID=198719 RepID=UPI00148C6FA9|nr:chymotrypsin-1-like [Drosophila innubila]
MAQLGSCAIDDELEFREEQKSVTNINASLHNRLSAKNYNKTLLDLQSDTIKKKLLQIGQIPKLSNINDVSDFSFLVTGGYRPEKNPLVKFIVSLRKIKEKKFFGDNHFCGGSIISKKVILTAAYCLVFKWKSTTGNIKIIAGTPRRLVKTENTQELMVDKIIPHPKYNGITFLNDIGIIKLKDEIRLSEDFANIIPINDRDPTGLKCTLVGWGRVVSNGPLSDEVVSGDVVVDSHADCSKSAYFIKGTLCAPNPNNYEVASCSGDSGGPLICDNKLVGIVSFRIHACGSPKSLSFLTDVYYHRDWISRNAACYRIIQFPCCLIMTAILIGIVKIYI